MIFSETGFPTCRPLFLKSPSGHALELDGYCSTLLLAFEYQGIQHYRSDHYFHNGKERGFESQQARDRLKVELCMKARAHKLYPSRCTLLVCVDFGRSLGDQ